jgi:aerobic carbon-monoxide dehydrogenase medium subunit
VNSDVSPRPVRIDKAEEMDRGRRPTVRLMEQIATEASRAVDPIDDLRRPADYKRHLVQVLVPRAYPRSRKAKREI